MKGFKDSKRGAVFVMKKIETFLIKDATTSACWVHVLKIPTQAHQ